MKDEKVCPFCHMGTMVRLSKGYACPICINFVGDNDGDIHIKNTDKSKDNRKKQKDREASLLQAELE